MRHDSDEPGSSLAPGQPGNEFKDVVTGEPDLLVTKTVNSCFHGTPSLQAWLDAEGVRAFYLCGITTNHCCETTARVGGNLGYDVRFVLDATHTFDRRDIAGQVIPAEEIARVTAANLQDEFATVIDTATALADAARRLASANVNCGWVGRVGVPPNVTGRSAGGPRIDVVVAQQPQRHTAARAPSCDVGQPPPPHPAAVQDAPHPGEPPRAAPIPAG